MELYFAAIALVIVASFAFVSIFGENVGRFVYLTFKIPGPSLWQLVTVHAKHLLGDRFVIRLSQLCDKYNYKPWGMWTTDGNFFIVVSDCESIGEVYKNKITTEKCVTFYKQVERFLGRTLITMPGGREYSQYRKVFTTGIRKSLQELLLPRMIEPMSEFVQEVRKNAAGGKEVDVRILVDNHMMAATFASLISSPPDTPLIKRYVHQIRLTFQLIAIEALNPIYYHLYVRHKSSTKQNATAMAAIRSSFDDIVKYEKSRATEEPELDENEASIFKTAVQSFKKLTDGEGDKFRNHARLLIIASGDTTSYVANVLLLVLALYQEVQQRVFEEIASVLGEKERPSCLDDLDQMIYMEMVIKETLRLFPAGAITGRITSEEVNLNDILAPKGSIIIVNSMALHRNPEYFPDPLKFDPDRFSPEASKALPPYSYIPFNAGSRGCPGQLHAFLLLKLFLCYTVRNFKIFPGDKLKSLDDIKIKMWFTMHIAESSLRFVDRISDKAC